MANVYAVVRDAAGYARAATAADTLCDGVGQPITEGGAPVTWSTLTGKPVTFPPDVHTHSGMPATVTLGADTAALTSVTLANVAGLSFAVAANTCDEFRFLILFQSVATTTGLKLGLTIPASPTAFAYSARIPIAADSAGGEWQGWGTATGDAVTGTGVQAITTVYVAEVFGVLRTGAAGGTLQVQAATEVANSGITIKAYSGGSLLTR